MSTPNIVIYGELALSPELRHEIPIVAPDRVLYVETDGVRHLFLGDCRVPDLGELDGVEVHISDVHVDDDGYRQMVAAEVSPEEALSTGIARQLETLGVTSAIVPDSFPLGLASGLTSRGIELTPNRQLFSDRRRVKTAAELVGIRRAQRAGEAGMEAARDMLRRAASGPGGLELDGEALTVERVRSAMSEAFAAAGAVATAIIVAPGVQAAIPHHFGEGPLRSEETIVIDMALRDSQSGCFCDMTRTFVVGRIPEEVARWHGLCKQALDRAISQIKPGVDSRDLYDSCCALFEEAGYPTLRTKESSSTLGFGFLTGLGHGVGLDVHEPPFMLAPEGELAVGEVLAIEPGLYRTGFGGLRLEDLILVTSNGAENLTNFRYDLTP